MTSVVNPTSNADIDGILWGWKTDLTNISFSFPTGTAEYGGYAQINGFSSFNATQQTAVRNILASVASFANLTFTETTNSGAYLRYADASSIDYTDNSAVAGHTGLHVIGTAEANPPELGYNGAPPFSPGYAQGDSWYNPTGYNNPALGSFQYAAGIMHETGHNLGLKHGHVTQFGHGVTFPTLPSDHNSYEYSVMTYSQFPGDNPTNGDNALDHPTTYMQDDIAALQYMYGANYGAAAHNGNTTYTWNPTTGEESINGVGQGAPYRNFVLTTIWDGGGNDTYDFSNYATNLSVDLNPGGWTILDTSAAHLQRADLGNNGAGGAEYFARGNIANALIDPNNPTETASLIENANGGAGNDTIVGNAANNTINGGGGNDIISGGAGNDTLNGGAGAGDYVAYNIDQALGGTQGVYVNLATGSAKDAFGSSDTLSGFENVFGTDNSYPGYPAWSDFLFGDNNANILFGLGGNDYLDGGAGSDFLYGGAGNDYLIGGAGNDFLYGGAGTDYFLLASEVQSGSYDFIMDFNTGGTSDFLELSAANQSATYFGTSGGYGYAWVNVGAGYTVLAAGVTGAQLQAQTWFG